jgi:hypothetical protein
MIGLAYRIDPEWFNLTLGLTAFLPVNQLAYLDSGETYEPEYFLYRSNTQQPDVTLAAGMEFTSWFRFGAGLHVAYNVTSSASGTLQASNPSTERVISSIKPKISPYFGLHLSDTDDAAAGLVVRLPSSEDSNFNISTGAQPFGAFPNIPVAFVASDTIVYQPTSIELGGNLKTSESMRSYLELDYQFWSQFRAPTLLIANPCAGAGCGVTIAAGPILNFSYRNILIPRIGEEISLDAKTKLRFGYAYRPGILKDPSNGVGNYLDPSKHLLSAGLGLVYDRFLGYHKPWNLDFSFNYQALVTQQITKTAGDETGTTANGNGALQKIGAPGYQAGGHIIGGQIALTVGI